MITILSRLFIPNRENTSDPKVRRSYGMLSSILGICLNIILFLGKYIAGVQCGSIAIMSDAFNNLSDAGSSIITLIGFQFAGMKPDANHPFGHGRIEYISGFIVSMAIILMGFELGKSSIEKILHPEEIDTSLLSIFILLASIGIKLYMNFYNRRIGRRIDSAAMRATATDSLSDAIATRFVLLAILVMRFTGVNVDGWCGVAVACFILFAGYSAARETLSPLLGNPPDPELVQKIHQIVMSYPEIVGMHDLIVHDYGPGRIMVSLHGEVQGDGDIFALHDKIDLIERELSEKLGCEATIHMDPIETNNETVSRLRSEVSEIAKKIHPELTIHDFRMVNGRTHTNLIFDVVVPMDVRMQDRDVINAITDTIRKKYPNYYTVIRVDKSYVM